MTTANNQIVSLPSSLGRRRFLKASLAASGGLMLHFSWQSSVLAQSKSSLPAKSIALNAYIHIATDGAITAMVPNPEFGQNLMTSMPMILAEELEADWAMISSKTAPYAPDDYKRQFTGGSQSIRQAWQSLRMAGAGARQLLRQAAAARWQVPVNQITTAKGVLSHNASNRTASYGEMASDAALMPLPAQISLKNPDDFAIIGQSRKNLEGHNIVTGKPMFGLDYQMDGMLVAMIEHPPAFGLTVDEVDLNPIKKMPGIVDAFVFDVMPAEYAKSSFDTTAFERVIAIVGKRTWDVMKAKKSLAATWKTLDGRVETLDWFGTKYQRNIPGGLESTTECRKKMDGLLNGKLELLRQDGDPENAFKQATKVIERTYYAPYLAHNTMEPMNFFANVTSDEVHVAGPLQAPSLIEGTVAARLKVPKEKVRIEMTRMGGGFGRRAYSHYLVEAAVISAQVQKPVKLIYSREDDMTMGIYRPSYQVRIRAALDANNQMTAYQVSGVGTPEHSVHADRFPAGAVDNYLAEGQAVDSNITTGAFRAPRSNFMASAEQAFLDEVAEAAGQDPIAFRLALFAKAKSNLVGDKIDYDPIRYAGVLELVRDKSGWQSMSAEVKKGVAAYYCHNSYAAHVITVVNKDNKPTVDEVFSAVDCGIVVNPDSAINMVEGAVIDGIGNAMYGEMTFTEGKPDKRNFDTYRMIRMNEIPRAIHVNFVDSKIDPTGLGEPPFPPVFAALANALYQSTGQRLYQQPFAPQLKA